MTKEILIREVRNRPYLYDKQHEDYKNARKKVNGWAEIAKKLKITENECRRRWKALRSSYSRCKRMEHIAAGSGDQDFKCKWRFASLMSFLDYKGSFKDTADNFHDEIEVSQFSPPDSLLNPEFDFTTTDNAHDGSEVSELSLPDNFLSPVSQDELIETYEEPIKRKRIREDTDNNTKSCEYVGSNSEKFVKVCSNSEQCRRSTTAQLFAVLANKIDEANLPSSVVTDLETSVYNIVIETIKSQEKINNNRLSKYIGASTKFHRRSFR